MTGHVRAVDVRSAGDHLEVAWDADPPTAVDVTEGPTPDTIDHTHAVTAPAGVTSVRLPWTGTGRRYVSVAPSGGGAAIVAAERHVPLEGVFNFRDLGGYPVQDGRRTRWGRVFRSATLHHITDADIEVFRDLEIQVVYDLRSPRERADRRPLPGTRIIDLPVFHPDAPRHDPAKADDPSEYLTLIYRGALEYSAPVFARLLTGLTEPGALPTVFHCTVGKDRTGLAAALLLEVLGVTEDDILDDYELTNAVQSPDYWLREMTNLAERAGANPLVAAGLFRAHRGAMETALTYVRERGGAIGYLVSDGGMAEDTVNALQDLLLEPS
jgi:protein-tyrosine phosphatase